MHEAVAVRLVMHLMKGTDGNCHRDVVCHRE